MSQIKSPKAVATIKSVAEYLDQLAKWQKSVSGKDDGYLSYLWYRGVNKHFPSQKPGVYRDGFSTRAKALNITGDDEDKRLHLEREIFTQFRVAGASHLHGRNDMEIYFTARHVGIPTRLLDWSMNPLSALFFACDGGDKNGFVYAIDARRLIPGNAEAKKGERLYRQIMSMRHPYVEYAIGLSYWRPEHKDHNPLVLPVRPDVIPGRISQQGSCFSLHMPRSPEVEVDAPYAAGFEVEQKDNIIEELHRLNVNQFTIYADLDHLSKEIKRTWGIKD